MLELQVDNRGFLLTFNTHTLMAKSLLVLGKPSTGKSTSLRTLDPKTTAVITPNTKSLPFPESENNYVRYDKVKKTGNVFLTEELSDIKAVIKFIGMKMPHITEIVLEDFSHYLTHRVLGPSFYTDAGYSKWNILGADVHDALFAQLDSLRDNLTLIVIHHTEVKESGEVSEKTAGKLMDNQIVVNSWYTVILHAQTKVEGEVTRYVMQTNEFGAKLAKSPPGMFSEKFVGNNMRKILDDMKAYYTTGPKHPVVFID
jgi:hypothetical protein